MSKRTVSISNSRKRAAKRLRESLHHRPALEELLSPEELDNASAGYLTLRQFTATLKKKRHEQKLTLKEVSERSGLALETLSRLETGTLTNPTWQTLTTYAAALGRSVDLTVKEPGHE